MDFTWKESDNEWTEYESTNEVSAVINGAIRCPECDGSAMHTSFNPDADSPSWSYECSDCEIIITVRPSKVTAVASDANL